MKMENFYHGSICASVEYVGLYFNIFGLYLVSIFIKNGLYFGLYRDQNQIETKLSNTEKGQKMKIKKRPLKTKDARRTRPEV